MAAFDFIALQNTLKAMGFYDFVLPWLLAFSIVFGILQTVNIFKKGKEDKPNTSVDAVISLAVAFYLTIFTPYSGFLSSFFSKLFGGSIIVLSGVLVLLMFIGIFGFNITGLLSKKTGDKTELTPMGIGGLIGALIVAAGLFINANAGVFSFGGTNLASGETLTLLLFFGIIGAVIWFVVSGSK
ncbi:MAG: hypothetical protein HY051_06485 [Candidatus Aenigmarchaeota archaeon]|nr:hypothetical protein [Candidatus Aenigmarchaeota archaeon]